jgi:hypothetical protein
VDDIERAIDAYLLPTAANELIGKLWEATASPEPLPDSARARSGDPKVSHVAADSIGNMKERHRAVLQVARTFADSFTYDELVHRYNQRRVNDAARHRLGDPHFIMDLPQMEPQSIRSRCAELRRAGWIEQAGRALSDAGSSCNTWRVTR